MSPSSIEELATIIEAAASRPLDQLTDTEALDVAGRLRAIAELPTPTPADQHLAHHIRAAAELIEQQAGVT